MPVEYRILKDPTLVYIRYFAHIDLKHSLPKPLNTPNNPIFSTSAP